jgi:hypothetical protein
LVFYKKGFDVNEEVIQDLSGMSYLEYAKSLSEFIEDKVTNRLLNEDLNPLVDTNKLKIELPNIKRDLLIVLGNVS